MKISSAALDLASNLSRLHNDIGAYTPKHGMNCLAYSPQEHAAKMMVAKNMADLGGRVFSDLAGNITCYFEGRDPRAKTVMIGSHLDAVPRGGRWDGRLGVLVGAAIAADRHKKNWQMDHGFAVQIFCAEESPRFGKALLGSGFATGIAKPKDLRRRSLIQGDKVTLAQAMSTQGLNVEALTSKLKDAQPLLPLGDIACFAETHIEQAPSLKEADCHVGIVTGIRGNMRADIRLTGISGHSGSMPGNLRADAQEGMVYLQSSFYALADHLDRQGQDIVRTVTLHDIENPSSTTIPSDVSARLEVRSTNPDVLRGMAESLEYTANKTAEKYALNLSQVDIHIADPVPELSPTLVTHFSNAAEEVTGGAYKKLPSGAGHDAMNMHLAGVPSVMVFTAHGGDSHCPHENAIAQTGQKTFGTQAPFADAVRVNMQALKTLEAGQSASGLSFPEAMLACGAQEITAEM